jgi:hypothetical protein
VRREIDALKVERGHLADEIITLKVPMRLDMERVCVSSSLHCSLHTSFCSTAAHPAVFPALPRYHCFLWTQDDLKIAQEAIAELTAEGESVRYVTVWCSPVDGMRWAFGICGHGSVCL